MKKKMRIFSPFVVILLLAMTGACIYVFFSVNAQMQRHYDIQDTARADTIRKSTPLTLEVIQDICNKFKIPTSDKRCKAGSVVHDVDFYDDIWQYYHSLPSDKANQGEVDRFLGSYLMNCSPFPDNPNTYYECVYDLNKDNMFPIIFSFDIYKRIKGITYKPGS